MDSKINMKRETWDITAMKFYRKLGEDNGDFTAPRIQFIGNEFPIEQYAKVEGCNYT